MIERLIISVVLLTLGVIVYQLYTRLQINRLAAMTTDDDPVLQKLTGGIPAVVYFTTPGCIPCKVQQQPALLKLTEELSNGVQVIKIDATQEPDIAARWGVMSAPTTFILDAAGKTRAVNHGVADTNKLKRQITATA